ncbi:MAG TPA: molybdopterin-dependent oxidoreductase [Terriglobia bacterium]|nr:molybdopterin-dependent oxidoreductase [Terriglobia bacterium]
MRRRNFLKLAAGSLFLDPWKARAEHYVLSADPWIIEFELRSLKGRDTSIEDFYVRNHFAAPQVSGERILRIEGEVESVQEVTEARLRQVPQHELGAVLECAGDLVRTNALVSNGAWRGWWLEDVLELARPTARGRFLHLYGADGYARSVPAERVKKGSALLATGLNGRPLTRNHGMPWRAFFPGWYGMDSVKWLQRVVVSANPLPDDTKDYLEAWRQPSGEIIRRPLPCVQVKSLITAPAEGSVLPRGRTRMSGVAWSGAAQIASVEVSDSISHQWRPATLNPGGRYEWTLWDASLEVARPGPVELICRAKDATGAIQPERRDARRIDYYTANWYHRVKCVVS